MKDEIKLILPQGELDINTDIGFGVTYSIDDIRTPENRNSSYTKTVTLPSTNNNNRLLGMLFDINSTFDQFNPNLKNPCKITVNSTTVLDGFIQLRAIKKQLEYDDEGNSFDYEVVVYDNTIDFFSEIGDSTLGDLDFSSTSHTWSRTNIELAWAGNDWMDGVQYPLMYDGNDTNGWMVEWMKPSFYHKHIVNKIFEDAGYTVSGSFWSNADYEKELVTMKTNDLVLSSSEIVNKKIKVGWSADHQLSSVLYTDHTTVGLNKDMLNWIIQGQSAAADDDTSGSYVDGGNQYDTTLYQWVVNSTGKYNIDCSIPVRITFNNASPSAVTLTNNSGDNSTANRIKARVTVYRNSTEIGVINKINDITTPEIIGATTTIIRDTLVAGTLVTDFGLNAGDVITFKVHYFIIAWAPTQNGTMHWTPGAGAQPITITSNVLSGTNSYITNSFSSAKTEGDTISMDDFVLEDFKQKDFILDIIKRYNLYLSNDPLNPKNIIMDSRDDYYSSEPQLLDWSDKKDYSKEDNIAFISELQNKEVLFSYNEADDEWNKNYTDVTSQLYGQHRIEYDNEFVDGEKKITSPFSLATTINNLDTPACLVLGIDISVTAGKINTPNDTAYISYWGGLQPTIDGKQWHIRSAIDWSKQDYTLFPYAGHYDSPFTPTKSIAFGSINAECHDQLNNTSTNNLYNRYWKNYTEQIATGKLLTSRFHLSEVDINKVKDNLGTKIFIDNTFYYINRIVDYDPTNNDVTEVELTKIDDPTEFIPTSGIPLLMGRSAYPNTGDKGFMLSGNMSTTSSKEILSLGESNKIGSNDSAIAIFGDNNRVDGGLDKVLLMGDDNIVDHQNVFGVANGITSFSNDTIYLNDLVIWDGDIYNLVDIQAGNITNGLLTGLGSNTNAPFIFDPNQQGTEHAVPSFGSSTIDTSTPVNNCTVLGGHSHNISAPLSFTFDSTIVSGDTNTLINSNAALIGAGKTNTLDGSNYAFLGTGETITITNSPNSFIGSGSSNSITNVFAGCISSGNNNSLSGLNGFIGAGANNVVSGSRANVICGLDNTASGANAGVLSGNNNTVSGTNSVISGGELNSNDGTQCSIVGGKSNTILAGAIRSTILGGQNNTLFATANNTHIIGNNISTGRPDTTIMNDVRVTGALMNDDDGISYTVKKTISIGAWDMDADYSKQIPHGLSATEWKTIKVFGVQVRNDADTKIYNLAEDGKWSSFNATAIDMNRTTLGFFDSSDFNSTGFSRGNIHIEYTPD